MLPRVPRVRLSLASIAWQGYRAVGGREIHTVQQLESVIDRQVDRFSQGQLHREELLDMATVLSLVVHGLERSADGQAKAPGVELEALRARSALQPVRTCIRWLRDDGRIACVKEMTERLLTAYLDARGAVLVVQHMEGRLGGVG